MPAKELKGRKNLKLNRQQPTESVYEERLLVGVKKHAQQDKDPLHGRKETRSLKSHFSCRAEV